MLRFLADLEIPIADKLIPNVWAFLAQLIAFIVMVIIVIKFAYKPVHNYIVKREEYERKHLDDISKNQQQTENDKKASQEILAKANQEAISLVTAAKKEAEEEKKKALSALDEEMLRKRAEQEEILKRDHDKMLASAKDEIVEIAMTASKAILEKNVDNEDNRKIVYDVIKSLGEKDGNDRK